MSFWIKTNRFVKLLFPKYIWSIPNDKKRVFLTFDDGPTPEITEWVLAQLEDYNAKGTFFCIGNNIEKYPKIFLKTVANGHAIGNHTFNHLNGWKKSTEEYLENANLCQSTIENQQPTITNLFRPPYGKIKKSQSIQLRKQGFKIIMWDIISYDFDQTTSKEQCLENVLKNIESGSIIVFHDSKKAWQNLEYVLPKTLQFLKENGFSSEKIDYNCS
jgi:peptidoglycan/xylan/chitin deacetylase (PgdA/CDA1 family)